MSNSEYFGALWNIAQITAFGMDVIENKEQHGEKFPFIKTIIQEIHGDVIGPVIQTVDSQITFNQQMNNAFQQAYEINKTKEDISNELRKTTEKKLSSLEEELKKREPDAGKIQKLWKWLKRNANWFVPTLTQVVLESIKMALS